MLCPACQQQAAGDKRKRKRAGRVRDQLCSRCGGLIGPEATLKRARDKESQLARFGLAGRKGRSGRGGSARPD